MKIEKIGVVRKKTTQPGNYGRTKNNNRRIYDSGMWRHRVRPAKLKMNPLCEICLEQDILTDAKEIDHIVPISRGGDPFDLRNLQSLCSSCHSRKSASEK